MVEVHEGAAGRFYRGSRMIFCRVGSLVFATFCYGV